MAELIASPERRKNIDIKHYVTQSVGMPTLTDIMNELDKPGRDRADKPRNLNLTPM